MFKQTILAATAVAAMTTGAMAAPWTDGSVTYDYGFISSTVSGCSGNQFILDGNPGGIAGATCTATAHEFSATHSDPLVYGPTPTVTYNPAEGYNDDGTTGVDNEFRIQQKIGAANTVEELRGIERGLKFEWHHESWAEGLIGGARSKRLPIEIRETTDIDRLEVIEEQMRLEGHTFNQALARTKRLVLMCGTASPESDLSPQDIVNGSVWHNTNYVDLSAAQEADIAAACGGLTPADSDPWVEDMLGDPVSYSDIRVLFGPHVALSVEAPTQEGSQCRVAIINDDTIYLDGSCDQLTWQDFIDDAGFTGITGVDPSSTLADPRAAN